MLVDGINLFISDSTKKNFFETMNEEQLSLNPTSFPWVFPKQNILYFILQEKEKI